MCNQHCSSDVRRRTSASKDQAVETSESSTPVVEASEVVDGVLDYVALRKLRDHVKALPPTTHVGGFHFAQSCVVACLDFITGHSDEEMFFGVTREKLAAYHPDDLKYLFG